MTCPHCDAGKVGRRWHRTSLGYQGQGQGLVDEILSGIPDGSPLAGSLLAILEWFQGRSQ